MHTRLRPPAVRCARAAAGYRGYSFTELLAALAIVAILLSLATPGLRRQLATAKVDSAASQMLGGLALARRAALSSGHSTTLCITGDDSTCSFAGSAWMMFSNVGPGIDSRRDPADRILRRESLPRGVHVSGTRGYATYLPRPRAASTLTFTFCHDGAPDRRRSVVVSQTGRPRLVRIDGVAGRCA